jgi:hypothetical protein
MRKRYSIFTCWNFWNFKCKSPSKQKTEKIASDSVFRHIFSNFFLALHASIFLWNGIKAKLRDCIPNPISIRSRLLKVNGLGVK